MKMKKLTNEEIAKVFAMYLDQPVITDCNGEGIICRIVNIGINSMYSTGKSIDGKTFNSYGIFNAKIQLTPLDKITDEHAIEVMQIEYGHILNGYETISIDRNSKGRITIKFRWQHIDKKRNLDDGYSYSSWATNWSAISKEVFQYLISKGYAVPLFFGVGHEANGKTAIELGLAIEKQ